MKKSLIFLSVVFLAQTTLANAATDWTPYLKPMMSGCEHPNPTDKLPAPYKASIASKKVRINPDDYDISDYEGDKFTTYNLKNATAFGQPLLKVEYMQGYEWSHLKLYFKDTKFIALRPQFKLPIFYKSQYGVLPDIINNNNGYQTYQDFYANLTFDKKDKSITCFSGL